MLKLCKPPTAWIFGLLLLVICGRPARGEEPWVKAQSAELGAKVSSFEPDAPAEILNWRIDVNDRQFPEKRRFAEYVRYKVYDGERAGKLLKLSMETRMHDGYRVVEGSILARMTLPDGTVRLYGKEAVQERELVKNTVKRPGFIDSVFGATGVSVKEHFIPLGSLPSGAIVEVYIQQSMMPSRLYDLSLQRDRLPVRNLELHVKVATDEQSFTHQGLLVNSTLLHIENNEKANNLDITGRDLPSLREEPLAGDLSLHSAAFISTYTSRRMASDKHANGIRIQATTEKPWLVISTIENSWFEDNTFVSDKFKAKAAALAGSSTDRIEQARRIHDFVQEVFLRNEDRLQAGYFHDKHYGRGDERQLEALLEPGALVKNDDEYRYGVSDILRFEMSLLRSAGFQVEGLVLPNRMHLQFSPKHAAAAFLADQACAISIDGTWYLSNPCSGEPLPFGMLPAKNCGSVGLLARFNAQDFIDVPLPSPDKTQERNLGNFVLGEDGTLAGDCTLILSGYNAASLRKLMSGAAKDKQAELLKEATAQFHAGAEVEILSHGDLVDPNKPFELRYRLRIPNFATLLEDRMVLQPFVFHRRTSSPFSAKERSHPIIFPYLRQEYDKVSILLPEGYEVETREAPASSPGKALSYKVALGLDPKTHALLSVREFTLGLPHVSVAGYPVIKQWHESIALSDQYKIVIRKKSESVTVQGH